MALIPTAVTRADLANIDSDINTLNTGAKAQTVQPRSRPLDWVTVEVSDDPRGVCFWTQKSLNGEWRRDGSKLGTDVIDEDNFDAVIVPVIVIPDPE